MSYRKVSWESKEVCKQLWEVKLQTHFPCTVRDNATTARQHDVFSVQSGYVYSLWSGVVRPLGTDVMMRWWLKTHGFKHVNMLQLLCCHSNSDKFVTSSRSTLHAMVNLMHECNTVLTQKKGLVTTWIPWVLIYLGHSVCGNHFCSLLSRPTPAESPWSAVYKMWICLYWMEFLCSVNHLVINNRWKICSDSAAF